MKSFRALGLYGLLTVVLTYPMAFRLRILDPGDSAFFAWIMSWEIHALKTNPASLPHANIYHPVRYALGMDEPVLGTTLLALPLSRATDDAVLLFNLTRLLTFVLSGFTAYLLARGLDCGEAVALFSGAVFAFSPIRTDQVAHLNTLGTQWLPLALLFVFRFFRTGWLRHALAAAFFFVLSAYACGYHGVIGLLVLPFAAMPLLAGRWRLILPALLAAGAAGAGLVPLSLLHRAAMQPHGFVRGNAEAVFHSATLETFLATSSWNWLYGSVTEPFRSTGSNNLFPGLVVPGVILAGAFRLRRRGEKPSREAWALVLLSAAAAFVALGPEVRLGNWTLFASPFAWLRRTVPFLESIRVTSRAGVFIALGLSCLAGRALVLWKTRSSLVALLGLAALAEGLVIPIPMPEWTQIIDSSRPPPPVYAWLASKPGEFAIVELPMLEDGLFRGPAFDETIYMVRSTLHWKRLVNGNAGVEPAHYRRIRRLALRFPSAEFVEALRELGTRYVVLHHRGFGPNKWARIARDLPRFEGSLRHVAAFEDVTVFEVAPSPPAQ